VLLFSGDSTDSITAKISDFGLATGIATTTFGASSVKAGGGTTAYKAPEVFDDMPTRASDVYAFAIVCWELLSGDRPWAGRSDSAILGAVDKRGERPPMPSAPPTSSGDTPPSLDVFALLSNMVVRCWQQEGDSRPKFSQITRQLEVAISQMAQLRLRWAQLRPLFVAAHSFSLAPIDVFISFRFAEVRYSSVRSTSRTTGTQRLYLVAILLLTTVMLRPLLASGAGASGGAQAQGGARGAWPRGLPF
jgi:serine/threonine protein kinase